MASRKPGRDRSGHVDPYAQRRRRYEQALRPLGLADHFARMPRRAQELFWQYKNADPVLEFDDTVPDDAAHRALRAKLGERFRAAVMNMSGHPIAVRDFFSVIAGIGRVARDLRKDPETPFEAALFSHAAAQLVEDWFEPNLPAAWLALHQAVVTELVAASRLDERLLTATFKQDIRGDGSGKYVIRMIVSATPPQVRQVVLDGGARAVYRVATGNEWDFVRWLSWDGSALDGTALGRAATVERCVPVYAQAHALRNLHARVNLPKAAPYLEYWLHKSLAEPIVVERDGSDLLVEFRVMGYRVGYLIVTPVLDQPNGAAAPGAPGAEAGCVVVRTFKFLTMERTPERRKLEQRLKLTRADVDWLRLHELATFTRTDLRDDPVLRPLLESCGCGHLFELAESGAADFIPQSQPFAAELKKYLRLAA